MGLPTVRNNHTAAALDAQEEMEIKATFTPGPWAVHKDWPLCVVPEGHQRRWVGGSVSERDDSERYAIHIATAGYNELSTFAHEIPKDQANANARLIAAAPDMYAACQAILSGWGHQDGVSKAVELARAAIAKARG